MKNSLVIKFAVIVVLFVAFGVGLPADTAEADTWCRIDLGFGQWMEGCPHLHTPVPNRSPLHSRRYPDP